VIQMLSTREVAKVLGVNEKMVYTLVSDKGLPATKVTGKWLFPAHLVEQWLERETINHPGPAEPLATYQGLLIVAGSNDPLLERGLTLFMRLYPEQMAVFGNMGSLGGLKALRRGLCHIAASHLVQDDEDFNFAYAQGELGEMPALVNLCRREQGLLLPKGNPRNVQSVADLAAKKLAIVNRPATTGTRLLLDRELERAGVKPQSLKGYEREMARHLDVGLEVLAGRADAGPAIRAVAGLLDLDFLPIHWERFDLLVPRARFFDKAVQNFLNMLHEPAFHELAASLQGYDLDNCGKMVFPG